MRHAALSNSPQRSLLSLPRWPAPIPSSPCAQPLPVSDVHLQRNQVRPKPIHVMRHSDLWQCPSLSLHCWSARCRSSNRRYLASFTSLHSPSDAAHSPLLTPARLPPTDAALCRHLRPHTPSLCPRRPPTEPSRTFGRASNCTFNYIQRRMRTLPINLEEIACIFVTLQPVHPTHRTLSRSPVRASHVRVRRASPRRLPLVWNRPLLLAL